MNYKHKIKNFLINKKEKKNYDEKIKEKKSSFNYYKNDKPADINFYQDLEYVKNNPSFKKFFERYNDIDKIKFQNKSKVKENKNRKEIFIEITEKIKYIKDQHDNNKISN